MSKNQKVCYSFQDNNGEVVRTRFYKPTSKEVLKRVKKTLVQAGKSPELTKRAVWELHHGPINGKSAAPAKHPDLRFMEKTHEMKNGQYQHERQNGKALAY